MSMLEEFKKFAMKGNVVDMAVGIVIGASFGKIVKSFVDNIIMPPVGMLIGGVDFSDLAITLKAASVDEAGKPVEAVTINYGEFANVILDFLIVAFAIFLVVKAVNKAMPKPAPAAASATKECPHCLSAVPAKAARCAFCTCSL
jgi:large conductance mechanosensitive channel